MDKTAQGPSASDSDLKESGPSGFEEFTPEVTKERGCISFRFRFLRAGSFHCNQTGMVFVVNGEVDLRYKPVQWDEDLLRSAGSMAVGPMFRIECPENAVRQLHLPHCEADPVQNPVRVANITDDGLNFIQPQKVTVSHVLINFSQPSLYGLVGNFKQFFRPVNTQVQMFLSPKLTRSMRRRFFMTLLPSNVPVAQVKAQHDDYPFATGLGKCTLIKDRTHSVHAPEAEMIQPEKSEYDLDFGPNFHPLFEFCLTESTHQVTISIQDEENKKVWEHRVDVPVFQPPNTAKVSGARLDFIEKVSDEALSSLLDKLQEKRVLTRPELEWAQTRNREDKARQVMDAVKLKGEEACSILVDAFCEVDASLSKHLYLM